MDTQPDRNEFIFALCHELANLLAGIRLEANLLDGRPDGDLTRSSERISETSARAGSLLAMMRPLIDPESVGLVAIDPIDMLDGLRSGLDDSLDSRVAIELKSAADVSTVLVAPDILHHLLLTAVFAAVEADRSGSQVRVSCRSASGRVEFVVEDAGPRLEIDPSGALRGRPLTLAVSEHILGRMAGGVGSGRVGDRTEVAFELPEAPA
jgi:signal transduction histidine kinase